jgi:flagella basal body P-ring formation protein FlgA
LDSARSFILAQTGEEPKNINVKLLSPTKSLQMPEGQLDIRFRPSLIGQYEGTQILTAELSVDGHGARLIPVRLDTQVFRSVVVTKKEVKQGNKFSRENVEIDQLPSSKVSKGTLQKLGDVLGRTSGMDLRAGTPVRFSEINDPPVIHRGETVEGVEKIGNVEITVSVRAVGEGRPGEEITVENTESHKILKARVVDENHVLIDQKKP